LSFEGFIDFRLKARMLDANDLFFKAAILMRCLQLPKVPFMLDLTALSMWRKTHDINQKAA
jgi:hypothetical protein